MQRTLAIVLLLALGAPALGQDTIIPGAPPGWLFGGNTEKYEVGTEVLPRMKPGTQTAYLKAGSGAECGTYAALFQTIAADKYRGKLLKFSARLDRQGVRLGSFDMFMFTSGPGDDSGVGRPLGGQGGARDNFGGKSISLGVPPDAREITFGFRLSGPNGTGWADAVRLEVVGDHQAASVEQRALYRKVSEPGWPGNIRHQAFHGIECARREQWLTARGVYELDERSLTTMARRSAPQGVQVALSE
jgi:hypothetical protein